MDEDEDLLFNRHKRYKMAFSPISSPSSEEDDEPLAQQTSQPRRTEVSIADIVELSDDEESDSGEKGSGEKTVSPDPAIGEAQVLDVDALSSGSSSSSPVIIEDSPDAEPSTSTSRAPKPVGPDTDTDTDTDDYGRTRYDPVEVHVQFRDEHLTVTYNPGHASGEIYDALAEQLGEPRDDILVLDKNEYRVWPFVSLKDKLHERVPLRCVLKSEGGMQHQHQHHRELSTASQSQNAYTSQGDYTQGEDMSHGSGETESENEFHDPVDGKCRLQLRGVSYSHRAKVAVDQSEPVSRLLDFYRKKFGVPHETHLQAMFDGEVLDQRAAISSLDVEEGDIIDVREI